MQEEELVADAADDKHGDHHSLVPSFGFDMKSDSIQNISGDEVDYTAQSSLLV
jgi:hypothetical protein